MIDPIVKSANGKTVDHYIRLDIDFLENHPVVGKVTAFYKRYYGVNDSKATALCALFDKLSELDLEEEFLK